MSMKAQVRLGDKLRKGAGIWQMLLPLNPPFPIPDLHSSLPLLSPLSIHPHIPLIPCMDLSGLMSA